MAARFCHRRAADCYTKAISIEAIEEAMASPERELAKSAHEAIMPMYEGRHYRLVSVRLALAASG
ncbi:MAG: hypothetical protein EOR85_10870 [Mesorhizobium sp.]|uniref:hypothetical protein n=1 Tax=Mesorhizobium sp. TaxID=1871066 RepID=UPI000FE998CA|nr:hypothetical protein [Mesorhizobium sp.]RWK63589.1 MAG: hypothetical protein EOR49_09865 [Mesorhizobium sp.]RWM51529.1 MAG: hypothetical protein EOR76_06140 [Mesorhizobium sp.]RWM60153.1 MAG: hypothetical protein EOR79_07510 [Mesorhizobium sp.]RWN03372.1 MAG: hypothetical protein EOR85_10870 [Mesorhizobium sp.]TJV89007.1 MAG: hypothetical protein E5X84_23525 [Mesorhizobium sp.]